MIDNLLKPPETLARAAAVAYIRKSAEERRRFKREQAARQQAARLSFSETEQTRCVSPLCLARMHEEAENAE
jgi:hypothetical protein